MKDTNDRSLFLIIGICLLFYGLWNMIIPNRAGSGITEFSKLRDDFLSSSSTIRLENYSREDYTATALSEPEYIPDSQVLFVKVKIVNHDGREGTVTILTTAKDLRVGDRVVLKWVSTENAVIGPSLMLIAEKPDSK